MTNTMIIMNESVRLMNEGVLDGTGEFVTVESSDGTNKQLELPEEIHTFRGWKERGYAVKKGEKAIAKFPIWKHTSKKVETEDGEEEEKTNMFMRTAAFFKFSQVEKIEAKGA